MQTAKIEIVIKRGDQIIPLKFNAGEVKSDSGYGRDLYVYIDAVEENGKTRDFLYTDVRYLKEYNFFNFLMDTFDGLYGKTLQTVSMEFADQ